MLAQDDSLLAVADSTRLSEPDADATERQQEQQRRMSASNERDGGPNPETSDTGATRESQCEQVGAEARAEGETDAQQAPMTVATWYLALSSRRRG